jgi:hypothetical protein
MHPDGGGPDLFVQPGGGKSWVYRDMLQGRARAMGFPPHDKAAVAARILDEAWEAA